MEQDNRSEMSKFRLDGKIVIITGGCGLLGTEYAKAIKEVGGIPIQLDIVEKNVVSKYYYCDVSDEASIVYVLKCIKNDYKEPIYGLINNAAIDPKFDKSAQNTSNLRLECFKIDDWQKSIDVGLTGAFLATKVIGSEIMSNGGGSIINVSSVLGHVAPNQSLYRNPDLQDHEQPVKPVVYNVVKHGIIGLTRYVATYWAHKGVRCNAISPGGVYTNHDKSFVYRLSNMIPMQRMAEKSEYNCAILFLLSEASSFMNGAVLQIDGGQTTW